MSAKEKIRDFELFADLSDRELEMVSAPEPVFLIRFVYHSGSGSFTLDLTAGPT